MAHAVLRCWRYRGRVENRAGTYRLVPLLTREAVEEPGPEVVMRATARMKSTGAQTGAQTNRT
ncbi:hypothetical protein [Streptomyces brevispora]|uniref:Uncharacterized protein n=1 Tax=Streptomyces brevispora TaxID=887462 RepID=A0ABZ1GG33_9ACTN|nr:hypothetical protein [Streptomyces brevispora]WSC18136.1 hypothetical protein OIE64_02060 [Streptomyces brevispora]